MADDKNKGGNVGERDARRNENEPEDRYGVGDIVVDAEDPAAETYEDGDPTSAKEGGLGNPEGVTGGTVADSPTAPGHRKDTGAPAG